MCSDAANGEYEGFKVNNEIGCSWEGEATTSESRLHLSDILEMLIRLDQQGIFMHPVDDSIAPDYSKVVQNPMCFLRMREKTRTEQYTSWLSFVEDFERICYNAMKYNQKRSQIWNAANLMLRQGKRCLEQQFSKHTIILGLNKMGKGHDYQEKNTAEVKLGPVDANVLPCKNSGEETHIDADKNFVSRLNERDELLTTNKNSSVSGMDVAEQKVPNVSPTKGLPEDVSVEIVRSVPEEDCRLMFDDQATECSSSFSGTQSESEDDSSAVDSQLRDGNGASSASTENVYATSRRKRRALDVDWKSCKQDIEWRCHWVERRIQRLQAESNKYKRVLAAAETLKGQRQQDGSVARTSDMGTNVLRCRLLRRKRRRRAEECPDSMLHMSSHPVFEIYEKQMHCDQEMPSTEEGMRTESQTKLEFDDFDFDLENDYEDNIVLDKDSIEHYLWQIEALQMQIYSLKDKLINSSTILEDAPKLISELEAPQSTAGLLSPSGLGGRSVIRELKGQGGTPSSRRRNSDFDINNVIMPDALMTNYVPPARHAFIETPHWRVIAESAAQNEEESSEEDTDDEVYKARHANMQVQERQHQYSPLALNRSRNLSSTKERPKSDTSRRGSLAKAASVQDLQPAIPISFGYIPKRKRGTRQQDKV